MAVFIRDAAEFNRRFNRRPGAPMTEQECWPILPEDAELVDKTCKELHKDTASLCAAVTKAQTMSEEIADIRRKREVMRTLAKQMLDDLMSGVDMDNPADALRLEIFGGRLRQLAEVDDERS
jgi:hypothetical protein